MARVLLMLKIDENRVYVPSLLLVIVVKLISMNVQVHLVFTVVYVSMVLANLFVHVLKDIRDVFVKFQLILVRKIHVKIKELVFERLITIISVVFVQQIIPVGHVKSP